MRALLACAVAAVAYAAEQGAGGLNISSLTVGAPAGHTAKLELADTTQSWSFGAFNDGEYAIAQGDNKMFSVDSDGKIHAVTKTFSTEALEVDGFISADGVRQWKLVKQEQFDVSAEGWSNTSTTSCGAYQMLGGYRMFGGGEVKKTFDNLPAHKQLRMVATFHFIDAWSGEYGYSRIDDNYVWTDTYDHVAAGGSVNVCGGRTAEGKFAVPIEVSIPHTASKAKISFGSTIDQDPDDESWGVSQVAIYIK